MTQCDFVVAERRRRGDHDTDQTNHLRVYIAALRRKLEPDPSHPRYLLIASGRGYRFQRQS